MTDPAIVLRKLAMLVEHVKRARRRRPERFRDLAADVDLQDALSMSVLVGIQEAVDVAFHVASDDGFGLPSSYAEAFELLARHGVLEMALAERLVAAAGLRNRLAHGYASVDLERFWRELPSGLEALDLYAAAMARHADTS
ncbi:MAG: DUF86 domain-containing protein [Deltaproteobacteria bacterium]|nr:DUF86 domain-containing protein [Deltaproteobacteria bacterium]